MMKVNPLFTFLLKKDICIVSNCSWKQEPWNWNLRKELEEFVWGSFSLGDSEHLILKVLKSSFTQPLVFFGGGMLKSPKMTGVNLYQVGNGCTKNLHQHKPFSHHLGVGWPYPSGLTRLRPYMTIFLLMLRKSGDITTCDVFEKTPINLGISTNHQLVPDECQPFQRGAALDPIQEITGTTPLHLAAEHGHMEVLRILLEHKADKDKSSPHGLTPLRLAALNGHTEVVKLLLEVAWMKLLGGGVGWWSLQKKRRCIIDSQKFRGVMKLSSLFFFGWGWKFMQKYAQFVWDFPFYCLGWQCNRTWTCPKTSKGSESPFRFGFMVRFHVQFRVCSRVLFCTIFAFFWCTSWTWGKCWEDLGFRLEAWHFKLPAQCKLS